MIEQEVINDLTKAYIQSYLLAMDELHNPPLAIQVATGVSTVVGAMIKNSPQALEESSFEMFLSTMIENQKKSQTKNNKKTDNKKDTQ